MFFNRDNPETDIYGANLYDRYLQRRAFQQRSKRLKVSTGSGADIDSDDEDNVGAVVNMMEDTGINENCAMNCKSILVCTGVYCSSRDYVTYDNARPSNHNHRDFVMDPQLKQPDFVVQNVLEAVKLVFKKELGI